MLHWAFLRRAGLVTFYGPALLPELGEHPAVLADTDRWLRAAWFGDGPLRFAPADVWTDELLDWDRRQDQARPRELRPSAGWVTIREGSPRARWSAVGPGRRPDRGPRRAGPRRRGVRPRRPHADHPAGVRARLDVTARTRETLEPAVTAD